MTLDAWISKCCDIVPEPPLASTVARSFLRETGQPLDAANISRTVCQMDQLDLLIGKPNRPGCRVRLTRKESA